MARPGTAEPPSDYFEFCRREYSRMFRTVFSEGSSFAEHNSPFTDERSANNACSSGSRSSALSISCFSSSVVSWYKYRIKSVCVKTFIIGSVFHHLFTQIDQSIPHPSQRRVNANPCAVRNFLKAHLQIVPHNEYMLLFVR